MTGTGPYHVPFVGTTSSGEWGFSVAALASGVLELRMVLFVGKTVPMQSCMTSSIKSLNCQQKSACLLKDGIPSHVC